MLVSGHKQVLCFYHLCCRANQVDVPSPESLPGHIPLLYSEDQELEGP